MFRRPTTSQLLAWSVPFLLLLVLVPEAPRVITTVKTHMVTTPAVTPRSSSKPTSSPRAPIAIARHQEVASVPPVAQPSTYDAGSSGSTASSATLVATGATANATRGTIQGLLEPPFVEVDEPLSAGTSWNLWTNAPLSATLTCAGAATMINTLVTVPADASGCVLRLVAPTSAPVSWKLSPS
jgi:hypothetical protein